MELIRLIDNLQNLGISINSVVITLYKEQTGAERLKNLLELRNVKIYIHRPTKGYPNDVELIVSEEGYGKNPYIETTKKLVVVTAPGPNSGKLGTCLSQLYHEHKKGVKAGYAKFETFPVWNLNLMHPVNIAYEAATADLDDVITTITFSKAMSANDLKQYIDSYDIEIVQLQARGFDTSGNRVTFFSRTDKGLDETFRILEQQAQSSGADFAGAIGMYALTSSDKVTAIQNDANTFLVDTSTDEQYRKSTTTIFGTKKDTTLSDDKVERVFSHSVAWDAEELGLVDYK